MTTDPDEPVDPMLVELRGLRSDTQGQSANIQELTKTVDKERTGRRLSIRLTGAAGLVIVLVIGGFGIKWRIDDARYSRTTCAERIERSEQIRRGIVGVAPAVVDALAQYGKLADDERRQVAQVASDAARKSVEEDIPPPDC